MRHQLFGLVYLLITLLFAVPSKGGDASAPSGPPPIPTRAIVKDGRLYRMQALFVPETRTRVDDIDGKKVERAYTVMAAQFQVASTPKAGFRVYTVGGKGLTDDETAAALAIEREVLLSVHGKLIDSRYTPLFSPDALVVYIRPEFTFPGYEAPPNPDEPAPQTPAFSSSPPPKGAPPAVGFVGKAGGEIVLTEYRWEVVSEYKPVHVCIVDPEGKQKIVTKVVSQTHFVPEPIETRLKPADLKTLDRAGKPTHGLFDELTDEPLAVYLQNAASEFDPAHLKLCQSQVAVVQGSFPVERLMADYRAPAAPTECFAHVEGDQLVLGRCIPESMTIQVPVTVKRDGKEVTEYRTEAKTVTKFVHQRVLLDKVKAQDAAGKKLDSAELTQRLATETPVMTATGDKPVDPLYLACLKPDTIVLTLPPMHAPIPAADAAPPPPPLPGAPQARASFAGDGVSLFVAAQAPIVVNPAAQAPPKAPAEGPPPRLVAIQALGEKLVLREPKTNYGYPPVASAPPGTKPETPKRQAFTNWDSRVLDASAFRLYEAVGRPMDPAIVTVRASRPIVALLSDYGKKVDPAWLSIYNPGAIVVYVRPEAMQFGSGYGGEMHAPPPLPAPADAPPQPPEATSGAPPVQ